MQEKILDRDASKTCEYEAVLHGSDRKNMMVLCRSSLACFALHACASIAATHILFLLLTEA